ncbi:MAG TPA: LPS export ABC transporter periplasmic protein LptC [Gammaproteobacteria bacterium]|jgi:lipopolysaccharide export system protein LptC|nr:LPS export ABC transporter periplasmic protein LptC [Gammaproteobacteria bacterium]
MINKNTLISVSALLAISLGVLSTLTILSNGNTLTPENKMPDAIMNDVTATIYDKMGKVSMRIVTPKLVHYTQQDATDFNNPVVTLYRNSLQPWVINANFAESTNGLDNVKFWDNVTVHHPASEDNPATIIKTTTLTVHPNLQTAETPALITLIQPNITVNAIGMTADMNSGDIHLLSQARGEYAPTS